MMRWLHRLGPESRSLKEIHLRFLQMLEDGRHIFDAAANALLGGTDPEVIRKDLFKTDRRINRTEQEIRREIVVHGSIHGAATFPALLVMMSLVKDAERVGDYCKNLFDLAVNGSDIGTDEQRAELIRLKDRISKLIVRGHAIYRAQDEEGAEALMMDVKEIEDLCDTCVDQGLALTGSNAATRVLTYRYFKRVVSHLGNIASSVVVPLDKLDYFDEPREN